MTTTFVGFCDAMIEDLTANVPGLAGQVVLHRYAAWDPLQFVAEAGERHLAVWPAAEGPEDAIPLVTGRGGDRLEQLYRIAYWEASGDESQRGVSDVDAAVRLLTLYEDVRNRLYSSSNLPPTGIAGSENLGYRGGALPERSGLIRWFQIGVVVRTSIVVS